MRAAAVALTIAATAALTQTAAAKDLRLFTKPTAVRALAAAGDDAVAILDSGQADTPFQVVRATSASARPIGTFGEPGADEPDVASDPAGRTLIAWNRPVSGGIALLAQPVPTAADRSRTRQTEVAIGTGTGVLAVDADGAAVVAFPDIAGDAAVASFPDVAQPSRGRGPYDLPQTTALSSDAPERRHRPLDIALTPAGPLVLDLVQRRDGSSLRVLGAGAPEAAIVTVEGLRTISATLAADAQTIAVAYKRGGRVTLATAKPRGAWRHRTLPGSSVAEPAEGAPAVVLDGSSPVVAWTRRPRDPHGARDLYAYRAGSTRRLTRTAGDDSAPLAAARAHGGVWLAWTHRGGGRRVPLLRRLG